MIVTSSRSGLHGFYWILPLLATVFWSATLLGLLLWWIVDDHHNRYQPSEASVVFISDVGAAHKSLFIAGTALTFIFYTLTLIAERWLRHLRRIPGVIRRRERYADILAVVFGFLGGLSLLLLSIFDAFNHSTAHWSLTGVFVLCIALSTIFQTAEIHWLEKDHLDRRHLRRSAIIKLIIVVLAVIGVIVFGSTDASCHSTKNDDTPLSSHCNVLTSVSASMEWFIAFLYDAYLATLILDLWPARKTVGHVKDLSLIEADRPIALHQNNLGGRTGGFREGENSNQSSFMNMREV